jgi:hypothetical protein
MAENEGVRKNARPSPGYAGMTGWRRELHASRFQGGKSEGQRAALRRFNGSRAYFGASKSPAAAGFPLSGDDQSVGFSFGKAQLVLVA